MNAGIRYSCIWDTYISNICTVDTWIKYSNIRSTCISYIYAKNTFIRVDEPRAKA